MQTRGCFFYNDHRELTKFSGEYKNTDGWTFTEINHSGSYVLARSTVA